MAAGRRGKGRRGERIEPRFGSNDDGSDFRLSSADRAVAQAPEPVRKRAAKAARDPEAARPEPVAAVRRRSFFGAGVPAGGQGGGRNGGGSGDGGNGGGSPGGRRGGGRARPRGFVSHVVRLAFAAVLWGGLAVAGLVAYFAVKLPQEAWAIPDRPPNVKIVSVNGELLANRGLTGGEAVSLDEMSPYIPQAVIAIEDRRFYSHYGVDPLGILRAFAENMSAGQTVQGGSTLTQQLAKNIFLNPEQTVQRKIQEAILAIWLEHKFTKDQILEMYLNRVYFGSGATGVEAAAQRYFSKSARDVTLSEAALLAGLLKAPSRLSPARDPAAAQARAAVVLQSMLDEKFIDKGEFNDAKAQKATKARSYWSGAQHYAADIVMRDLKTLVGEVKSDVVVETTIDLGLEKDADKAIRDTIDGAKQNVSQGALVAIDGTGAIRALVGGRDYADSQFNRAVDAKRQPGSAFKPFVYETALEAGWRPESMADDAPTKIGDWTPSNYDNKFRGPVTLADALAHSLNTIAAQLAAAVTPKAVIETAQRMGITSQLADNASIALGTSEVSLVELTGAFAPLANGGYLAKPHLVNRVTDASGKSLYERGAQVPPIILRPDIVAMMNAMLTRTITMGTGRKAALKDWQAAGKTGTTQDFKDAWFVGYTANLTTGVWFGNDNGAPMKKVTGGTLPAAAWHGFMTAAHEGLPAMPLPGDYVIGGAHEPLTASNGGVARDGAPANDGGFYDSEMPEGDGPAGGAPPNGQELGPIGGPTGGGGPSDGVEAPNPPRGLARGAEPAPRRILRASRTPDEGAGQPDYGGTNLPPDEIYGVEPLPGDDRYGERGLPDDYYDRPSPLGRPEEVMPARRPARVVRRDQLPPGAVLEGPVDGPVDGQVEDGGRSLLRQFFGG